MGRDIKTANYLFAFLIVGLTILFGSALFLEIKGEFDNSNDYALIEGKASYNKDLLYRRWASMHGGVYVPITDETTPNPVLSHIPDRDITSEYGVKLTLVNPAYMTRQVHEIAEGQYGVKGHITSLDPIRKENKPDEWETQALRLFETGETEFSSVEKIDSMKYFRYMHAMTVEESCLKCHAIQGYKIGDVRGGISVSVPMDKYDELAAFHIKNQAATYLFVYAFVLLLTGFGFKRLKKEILNRNLLQTKIIESEALLSRSQEMAHVGSWELDLTANKLTWSDETYRIFGCQPQEFTATYEAFLGFIHPDDRAAVEEAYSGSVREGTDSYEIEHRIVRQETGEIRHVYERCVHVRDYAGAIIKSIGMVQDITEDKLAEKILFESENQYRSLFENMNSGFVLFEVVKNEQGIPVDLIILTVNEGFEKTTGLNLKDAVGLNLTNVLPGIEKDEADWIGTYSKVALTGEAIQFEQGSELLGYFYSISAFRAAPDQCAVTFVDITERKQAEEKVRESESRFRKLYEDGANGMVMVGKDFKFLMANRTFCQMTGYQEKELQQLTFVDITHPDDKNKDFPHIQKMTAGEIDVYRTEKRFLNKNGQTIWTQLTVSPFHDSNGQFLYNIGIIVNITERKNAEEDLMRMTRIMKNSQEIAHLGSFEYVAATQTTIWSEEEYRIYGLDPDGPSPEYNEMLEKCIHPDDAKLLHDAFMAAMQNQDVYELEHRIVRPDGSVRWVYDKAHPYFDQHGNLLRYVGATLDITERKLLQEELEMLNKELEKKVEQRTALLEASNKELEAFSYSVSHDLRSPLRHINGYIGMLNKHFSDELPEKVRHYLDTISGASSQMGALIDDLLQYSRTGRQEIIKKELDMNLLVKEVFEEVKSDAKGREINWDIQKLPNVYGDNVLLKQVWANLMGNAVKYTRNKQTTEISVGFKVDAKDFVFCVSDNGVGFDMKYAHKLFGVFQRLHSQSEFEGTGIGLANVQRIVHKHLGRVWVEAEPGKGAKFFFSLPKYQEKKS